MATAILMCFLYACTYRFLVNVKFLRRGRWETNALISLMVAHLGKLLPLFCVVEQIRWGITSNFLLRIIVCNFIVNDQNNDLPVHWRGRAKSSWCHYDCQEGNEELFCCSWWWSYWCMILLWHLNNMPISTEVLYTNDLFSFRWNSAGIWDNMQGQLRGNLNYLLTLMQRLWKWFLASFVIMLDLMLLMCWISWGKNMPSHQVCRTTSLPHWVAFSCLFICFG